MTTPQPDSWRTATALAVVPTIFAVLFGTDLVRHHLPVAEVVVGVAAVFTAIYTFACRLHDAWRANRATSDDQR